MHVVVRADGGTHMGSGHIMRCLALAEELVRRGARVTFVCRELPGHLIDTVERRGHTVVRLPPPTPAGTRRGPRDVEWLGVSAVEDARETRAAVECLRPDWLVVDHYGIDAEWERSQQGAVAHICVIDDLADRDHYCDVLIDQGYVPDATTRYDSRVPASCRQLLGPRYALLGSQYAQVRGSRASRDGKVRRVLVFFGGSDSTNETSKALHALSTPELSELTVDVVLGSNHPAPEAVEAQVRGRPNTTLHRNVPTLAHLMSSADLAVGAGGMVTWERLALRLPSVVVTLAANQELSTASLAAAGLVHWAGRATEVTQADLVRAIHNACKAPPLERSLVDGYGTRRVSALLMPPPLDTLNLVHAAAGDSELLFDWRNEATTRAMSFDADVVPWEVHSRWLAAKLRDPNVEIFIASAAGVPVGQARLDYRDDEALLSYSVDCVVRGLGFGAALVAGVIRACRRAPARGFRASVKVANLPSIRIFERLGWQGIADGENIVFRLSAGRVTG